MSSLLHIRQTRCRPVWGVQRGGKRSKHGHQPRRAAVLKADVAGDVLQREGCGNDGAAQRDLDPRSAAVQAQAQPWRTSGHQNQLQYEWRASLVCIP